MQGKHFISMIAAAALVAVPALAGPPVKKPVCQAKAQTRDAKRPETCPRPAPIPPVVDPTPLFLASAPDQAPQYAALY